MLEIYWNLVDAPGKFYYFFNVIFACWVIFSTLCIGKWVGWHNDECWSELLITCSFIDIRTSDLHSDIVWLVV